MDYALLFDRDTSLEVTEYRLEPEVHISEWFQSSGLAAVYLISGTLEVEIEGEGSWQLEAGDFIRYDADLRHRWSSIKSPHMPFSSSTTPLRRALNNAWVAN